ncbi:MAG: ThiF family adenylyltransferase [Candidatus Competibacteraceae bacterium]|nr:ThiF family adenylyltransferase [Candidatus Competibacteraceae bacterium]MCP5125240.1 ThiF family adenylyltransferase [Gammaproteobacteria bacterium]HRX70971.1 ThiF family adenylyltransferase [Candidatus Competibacteraceae bacterium]
MTRDFDYAEAFSRNIGWVTETEQALLRSKRVAIAGMGGVGGAHLLTLARLGIGAFHIADLDAFELANFNRQAGAMLSTLGEPKVEVLARQARDINPQLDLQLFSQGVSIENMDEFLSDVDLFVDGLDFFVPEVRALVFGRCYELGIPAITAGPIGMGAPYLIFLPGGMSFEEYFRLEGLPVERQYVNFLLGLTPKAWHRFYLVDPHRLDLAHRRGPSTPMACQLCAGIVGIEALKILLHRQPVYAAPWYHLFECYRGEYVRSRLRWGNRGPLQTLKRRLAYRAVGQRLAQEAVRPQREPEFVPQTELEQILDLARWAPSGDNTQPWRFEILNERRLVVHGFDTRDEVVYDLQGHASQLALGGVLETINIAAQGQGLRCEAQRREGLPETRPTFDVKFSDISPERHFLEHAIRARVTNRRSFSRQPLDAQRRSILEASVGAGYRVLWLEGRGTLRQMARLLFDNAEIRLTMPEAYSVHKAIIEWNAQFSRDRIPDQAVGLDPVALRLMRWALQSWGRVRFLNTYLGGTLLPRLQLDVLPALNCAAHFVIVAETPLQTVDDYVAGGRAMQRFWLTATDLGLQFQPEMTPLIFASYIYNDVAFSASPRSLERARRLVKRMENLMGLEACRQGVYMGRVGFGPAPVARSLRLPLAQLMAAN